MDYEITAEGPAGANACRAPNEHDAYTVGRQFEKDGSTTVRIKAPNGDVFDVREFYQQIVMRGGPIS